MDTNMLADGAFLDAANAAILVGHGHGHGEPVDHTRDAFKAALSAVVNAL
jgi:hypothetical protein